MSSDFAGIPGMSRSHFLWALALVPGPTEQPKTFTEIHRDWPEQPPGYDVLLEYALDILAELGHVETTHHDVPVRHCTDDMTVRAYRCASEAESQREKARAQLL